MSAFPLPCGEGLGVGVGWSCSYGELGKRQVLKDHPTPTPTLRVDPPRKGEGKLKRHQR